MNLDDDATPPTALPSDRPTSDECLQLLSRTGIGRLVYTQHALPVVLPVRFRLDFAGALVLTAPLDAGLVERVDGNIVAFHAEEFAPGAGDPSAALRGTSVMAHGRADAIDSGTALRIVPQLVTGTVLDK